MRRKVKGAKKLRDPKGEKIPASESERVWAENLGGRILWGKKNKDSHGVVGIK